MGNIIKNETMIHVGTYFINMYTISLFHTAEVIVFSFYTFIKNMYLMF